MVSHRASSKTFQNHDKKNKITVQELSLPTKTGDHSHQATSFITRTHTHTHHHLVRQRPVRYQIVLLSAFRRAPNRAFFCVWSCSKSCSFLPFVVLQIVLFSAFGRAPNRAFFCVSSCSKSRFFLRFVVLQIVPFSAFRRALNRAFLRAPNRAIFLRFVVLQIVPFSGFRRAPNRVFFWVSSCAKLCPKVFSFFCQNTWKPLSWYLGVSYSYGSFMVMVFLDPKG